MPTFPAASSWTPPPGLTFDQLVEMAKDRKRWRLGIPALSQKSIIDEQKEAEAEIAELERQHQQRLQRMKKNITDKELKDLEQRHQQQLQQLQEQLADEQASARSSFIQFSPSPSMCLLPQPYMAMCPPGQMPHDLLTQLESQFPQPQPHPPLISNPTPTTTVHAATPPTTNPRATTTITNTTTTPARRPEGPLLQL